MKKFIIAQLIIYIVGLLIWFFSIVLPIGKLIFTHIQDVVNKHVNLDMFYIGKEILYLIGWSILLSICMFIIQIIVLPKS